MGPYKRGQPVNLVERFFVIDPITQVMTPADPTTVTFTLLNPDDVSTDYVYGVDTNVTKVSTGVYVCALPALEPPGIYTYECVGAGAVVATSGAKTFEVLDSDVLPVDPATVATPGPCSSWIDGVDVAATCSNVVDVDPWELDSVAAMASQLMYELSGRQFTGICERKVRPCRRACNCFGVESIGIGPWFWTSSFYGGDGAWTNEGGDKCGCGNESYIKLAGYPVRDILEVKQDGLVLAPTAYRLDQRKNLIRMADVGPPVIENMWPSCQQLDLDDDQPGTLSVTYTWGTPPPELGKRAAAQLACEMWSASTTGDCNLPSRVTKIVRQGITLDRTGATATALRGGLTGLPLVDMFLAQTNPTGMKRRPAVFSPDLQKYARRLGQNES